MHGGGGEAAAEVILVGEVAHGNDGVGDGGTDVGAHDHEDGGARRARWHRRGHDDGGGGGRGLDEDGGRMPTEARSGCPRVEHLGQPAAEPSGCPEGEHEEEDPDAVMTNQNRATLNQLTPERKCRKLRTAPWSLMSTAPKDTVLMNLARASGLGPSASGSVHFFCLILSRISASVMLAVAFSVPDSEALAAASDLNFETSSKSSTLTRPSLSWSFLMNFSVGAGEKEQSRQGGEKTDREASHSRKGRRRRDGTTKAYDP